MEEVIKSGLQKKVRGEIKFNESLQKHTSFQVGGPAKVLIIPYDIQDLKEIILYLSQQKIPYIVIGNGTNLLVVDEGISGIVIKMVGTINHIDVDNNQIWAGAGALLPRVAKKAAEAGLSGLEFAAGLPATVGGATVMNAGVGNLNDMSQIINKVRVLTSEGEIKKLSWAQCNFAYRSSRFQSEDLIVLEVELELEAGDPNQIEAKMEELITKRKENQPLSIPNAGCIFKNPADDSAGRLIDEAGGKGMQIGGAKVSEKHANFIVNEQEATAQDILDLIARVRDLVRDKYGVELEREIRVLDNRR